MYPLSYLFGLNRFCDGAWFEATPPEKVEQLIDLLDIKPGQHAVDLGSGDGRVVLAMAKKGAYAVGIEKDEKLVKESNHLIQLAGFSKHAKIIHANLWDIDLSSFEKVSVYQIKTIMKRLEQKLQKELPTGAYVVSNYWQFPTWKPSKKVGDVLLYIR